MFPDSSKKQQLTVREGTGKLQQTIELKKQSYSELCSESKQLRTPLEKEDSICKCNKMNIHDDYQFHTAGMHTLFPVSSLKLLF